MSENATRVLVLCESTSIGGSETVLRDLFGELRRAGRRVLFAGKTGAVRDWLAPFADEESVPPESNDRAAWRTWLSASRPDLVIGVLGRLFCLGGACRELRIPSLWMCTPGLQRAPELREKASLAASLFDCCVTPSLDAYQALGHKAAKVIANGIDTKRFAPSASARESARRRLGVLPGEFLIGYAARYVESKRHAFLLNVFKTVQEAVPKSRLLLLGSADDPNARALFYSLKQLERDLGIQDKVLRAEPAPEAMPLYLAGLDAFAFPAIGESAGCALLEAMAMELPVVAVSDGGVTETLRPKPDAPAFSYLCEKNDPDMFARHLISIHREPAQARRLALTARGVVLSRHSSETMGRNYDEVLQTLKPLGSRCQKQS